MGSLTSLDLSGNNHFSAYGQAFAQALAPGIAANGSLTSLILSLNGLNAEAAKALAPAIAANGSLTTLKLSNNQLCGLDPWGEGTYTGEGITAIADALRVNSSLTSVSLLGNQFDDETVTMLLKLKEEKPNLTTLCGLRPDQTEANFAAMRLNPQDAKLLKPEIVVNGSLTTIDLSRNNLGGNVTETSYVKATSVQGSSFNVGDKVVYHGKEMIVSKGKDSDGDIKMKPIPDLTGVIALADALQVNGSLTTLDVRSNDMGGEGEAIIRKAVEGREGFVLEM